jgi:hypothetical protein
MNSMKLGRRDVIMQLRLLHCWYLQGSSRRYTDEVIIAERLRDGQCCRRNTWKSCKLIMNYEKEIYDDLAYLFLKLHWTDMTSKTPNEI